MTEKEWKQLKKIIESLNYGKVIVNIQEDKIINVKKIQSIKLDN